MEETGLKEGDEIDVKLIGMDPKTNKLKLSRKVLLPKPEGYVEQERRPRGDRPERGERHGRSERKGRVKRLLMWIFSGGKVLKFRVKYCTIPSFLYLRCSSGSWKMQYRAFRTNRAEKTDKKANI